MWLLQAELGFCWLTPDTMCQPLEVPNKWLPLSLLTWLFLSSPELYCTKWNSTSLHQTQWSHPAQVINRETGQLPPSESFAMATRATLHHHPPTDLVTTRCPCTHRGMFKANVRLIEDTREVPWAQAGTDMSQPLSPALSSRFPGGIPQAKSLRNVSLNKLFLNEVNCQLL